MDRPPKSPPQMIHKPPKNITDHFHPVTRGEIFIALRGNFLSPFPGSDGIPWAMVAATQTAIPNQLCNIYNSFLRHRIHPTCWKNAKCVLIPKPRKKKKDQAKSYRPISPLNCLSKTLEKIVA